MNGISNAHFPSPLVTFPGRGRGIDKSDAAQNTDNSAPSSAGNPAQQAAAALVSRPDLASKPFGSIASLFAQGLPLPPDDGIPNTTEVSDTTSAGGALGGSTALTGNDAGGNPTTSTSPDTGATPV